MIMINVNFGSQIVPGNDSEIRMRWQSKIRFQWCPGIFKHVQATNNLKIK